MVIFHRRRNGAKMDARAREGGGCGEPGAAAPSKMNSSPTKNERPTRERARERTQQSPKYTQGAAPVQLICLFIYGHCVNSFGFESLAVCEKITSTLHELGLIRVKIILATFPCRNAL